MQLSLTFSVFIEQRCDTALLAQGSAPTLSQQPPAQLFSAGTDPHEFLKNRLEHIHMCCSQCLWALRNSFASCSSISLIPAKTLFPHRVLSQEKQCAFFISASASALAHISFLFLLPLQNTVYSSILCLRATNSFSVLRWQGSRISAKGTRRN